MVLTGCRRPAQYNYEQETYLFFDTCDRLDGHDLLLLCTDCGESTGQSDEVSFILGNIIYKDFDSWSNEKKAEFADRVSSVVRKTAHMTEYGILCFLWFEALGGCAAVSTRDPDAGKAVNEPASAEVLDDGDAVGKRASYAESGLRLGGMARGLGVPFVITIIYAATDEFHQRFVTGRTGKVADVLIDACGALIVCMILGIILFIKNRRTKNTV